MLEGSPQGNHVCRHPEPQPASHPRCPRHTVRGVVLQLVLRQRLQLKMPPHATLRGAVWERGAGGGKEGGPRTNPGLGRLGVNEATLEKEKKKNQKMRK